MLDRRTAREAQRALALVRDDHGERLRLGGLFLLVKATREIHKDVEGSPEDDEGSKVFASFTAIVTQIAVIDLVFSVDSIITAIGMADHIGVMVAAVVQEEPLGIDDVIDILGEASQLRGYARALEYKSRSLEAATAELRTANERLKSLDQLKDDFMSSVTHELRTPLTSIRALSELMLDAPDMEQDRREEFLRIVVSESERLSRLINQVLDMAKIESGHAEWNYADLDMRTLVANAVRATSELFRDRGAVVELSIPAEIPPIRVDPDRLMQVMLNLLANAAKFVPAVGGRVDVLLRSDGDGLVVEVRDNGPGVPADEQALVFEKFRQGGDIGNRPQGTGLGLPICRRIIDHFGGRIWLESQPGKGACFAFRLPFRSAGGEETP